MTWEPELDELERRKQRSFELGGEERVQRHHDNGRFTVRERLDMILERTDERSQQPHARTRS